METKTFTVPNMSCGGCVNAVESALVNLDGVQSVKAVLETQSVSVIYGAPTTWDSIVSTLTAIDYAPA